MIRKEILKTGDSLCLIIPKAIADLMGIQKGSPVDLDYVDRKLTIEIPAEAQQS